MCAVVENYKYIFPELPNPGQRGERACFATDNLVTGAVILTFVADMNGVAGKNLSIDETVLSGAVP